MHLEYIKIFYEVALARSISKVAISSHISQPALSQQIQRLEDSLNLKLLERSNKGVELTEAGCIVEKYAKHLIKLYDNMLEDLNDIKRYNNTIIRISASPIVATYALPCTIYKLKEKFPDYSFNLSTNLDLEVEQQLVNDGCDIGFVIGKPNDSSLAFTKIAEDKVVVVAAADYRIKSDIDRKDIKNYPLILLFEKLNLRRELNNYFSSFGDNLEGYNILFNLDSTESIKSTVVKGYGLSFLPHISIKKELYTKQLKEINVKDFNMMYDIYITYKKEKHTNRNLMELIQHFKKTAEKSFC